MTGTTPVFTKTLQFSQFLSTVPVINSPAAPYILYWDGTRMQVGAWGPVVSGGKANMSNLLYFKFGGVVGVSNVVAPNGTAWPGADAVKFNPVTGSPDYADYTTIPFWNGTDTSDGYISSTSYHTKDNVLAGRGDPCKLVGLTITQIRAGAVDNGKFRLPTNAENIAAYSSPTYVAGNGWVTGTTPTAGIHTGNIDTSFLPAAGEWAVSGISNQVGYQGHYWSSRAYDSQKGYFLQFGKDYVDTSEFYYYARLSCSVRCVPQS
jgi:hypothetical protein